MMYQGGKTKIAKPIGKILRRGHELGYTRYLEPFLGSAAMLTEVADAYEHASGSDAMEDVLALWFAAVKRSWVAPETLTENEYRALENADPSALRAFAGFPCSFGGKWFGGYARDPKSDRNFARAASRSIERRAAKLRTHPDLHFANIDYRAWQASADTVIYADPPYANTLAYAGAGAFDSSEFWRVAAQWASDGAAVFVSEYTAPSNWLEVWSIDRHTSTARNNAGKRATDRLFTTSETAAKWGLVAH